MKKRFGLYTIYWTVLLALFNAIAFFSVGWAGYEKYTASFWIGYSLITITFLGQLICSYFALSETNAQKLFYRISLVKTSYTGLISTFVFAGLCMLISPMLYWVSAILCAIVLVSNIFAVLKAVAVVDEVERIDRKVKQQTFFIKSLTVDADTLLASAKSNAIKTECKKVYEAVRYSDPMSSETLAGVESQITIKFAALSKAVAADDVEAAAGAAAEVLTLLKDRNSKCKLLK